MEKRLRFSRTWRCPDQALEAVQIGTSMVAKPCARSNGGKARMVLIHELSSKRRRLEQVYCRAARRHMSEATTAPSLLTEMFASGSRLSAPEPSSRRTRCQSCTHN